MPCFDFTRGWSHGAMRCVRPSTATWTASASSPRLNVVGDNVDAAVDTANDEICSQLVEIESRELGQIEHALQRIVEGVYGRCEFCGGKIAEARLNALPYTNSCIDCQRENERHGQAFGRGVRREPLGEGLRKADRGSRDATPRSISAISRWI